MDLNPTSPPPLPAESQRPPQPGGWTNFKKALGPLGVVVVLFAKFFAKVKFLILPLAKYGWVILKTGGTMLLSIWAYTLFWGWRFAAGVVVLIFIHECGHLLAAKRIGLKVGAPVFIPFMGAVIALKEAPRDAWIEAQVGIGGPMLGAAGSLLCYLVYVLTGNQFFCALAWFGCFNNLFNLIPIGFLDGGRIVTALSPWLWLVGFPLMVWLAITTLASGNSFLLVLILLASVPRLMFLFRKKTEAEQRYFEVTPERRWAMAAMYFGLITLLAYGMKMTLIPHHTLRQERQVVSAVSVSP